MQMDVASLGNICMQATPGDNYRSLLNGLSECFPDLSFEPVLHRGGWYRVGGLYDGENKCIANDLASWVEKESAGDIIALYNKYIDEPLYATRLNGKTHYLVAKTGERPQDFIQLEIEEVEEVIDRRLFDKEFIPELVEEIIDPLDYERLEPVMMSQPRYLFRRVIPIADYLDELSGKHDRGIPILRFMSDWQNSSATEAGVFCKHWVLSFREYVDGYGEPNFSAKPITTYTGEVPVINADELPRGAELANLIHSFDRKVGYPMAWYFFMLTHKQVTHQIAEAIHKELMGAYAYLPVRDMKVLRNWYDRGYGV